MKKKLRLFLLIILGILILINLFLFISSAKFWDKKIPQEKIFRGVAWFRFNQQNSLKGWEEKIFKGKVIYSIKKDKDESYLDAYSKSAASGMLYWIKFNPKKHPMISWRWKVTKFPEKKAGIYEEGGWMEKDDYAARFYVIFPRFPFTRFQCLEYIWSQDLANGTVLTNPNFKNLKIIVVESGETNLNKWVFVERNVYADFKKVFGRDPGNVGAIAIMTDADNTLSTAQAQYNDIEVGYEN